MHLVRGMLSITIHLDGDIVALVASDAESGLHRTTDTEVAWQRDQARACSANRLRCIITRSVVDHCNVIEGVLSGQLLNQRRQRKRLAVGRNNDKYARLP